MSTVARTHDLSNQPSMLGSGGVEIADMKVCLNMNMIHLDMCGYTCMYI